MLDEGRREELSENAKMTKNQVFSLPVGFLGVVKPHTDTKAPGVLRTSPDGIRVRFI